MTELNETQKELVKLIEQFRELSGVSKIAELHCLTLEPGICTSMILQCHVAAFKRYYWSTLASIKKGEYDIAINEYKELKLVIKMINETIEALMREKHD